MRRKGYFCRMSSGDRKTRGRLTTSKATQDNRDRNTHENVDAFPVMQAIPEPRSQRVIRITAI
jgi:hypothetical protein